MWRRYMRGFTRKRWTVWKIPKMWIAIMYAPCAGIPVKTRHRKNVRYVVLLKRLSTKLIKQAQMAKGD
jgi:hypothetical protein